MFCVGYCGINCYRSISRALAVTQTQSKAAKTLQHQLFNALVIQVPESPGVFITISNLQTLIPSVLMYLPLFFVFALPIFGINIPYASSCISATISLYTAIDPLPSMFIIKTYRKAIISTISSLDLVKNFCFRGSHKSTVVVHISSAR